MTTFRLPMPPSANVYWRNVNGYLRVSQAARDYEGKPPQDLVRRMRVVMQMGSEIAGRLDELGYQGRVTP